MNITSRLISKLQNIIARFQMRHAAFLLFKDYKKPSMYEFTTLDSDDFLDYI